jgi:hypothetical protein
LDILNWIETTLIESKERGPKNYISFSIERNSRKDKKNDWSGSTRVFRLKVYM